METLAPFLVFKILIGFVFPMLVAWRELVVVNRAIAAREAAEAQAAATERSAPRPRAPVVAREREHEPA
jgi:hypothetical protein